MLLLCRKQTPPSDEGGVWAVHRSSPLYLLDKLEFVVINHA